MIVRARFRGVDEPIAGKTPASFEARALALAYAVEQAVEEGLFLSVAEVAAALGVSRSRLSQVLRARWSSVEEQEKAIQTVPVWLSGP